MNEIDQNNTSDEDIIPDVMYQVNVKRRKDEVYTAGKWTDKGKERYNEFISIVQIRRSRNKQFKEKLKEEFIKSMSSEAIVKKRKKREQEETKIAEKRKRVIVKNILNLTEV